ncbi:hypothetical protein [Helicobacter sp. T3_23-1056]
MRSEEYLWQSIAHAVIVSIDSTSVIARKSVRIFVAIYRYKMPKKKKNTLLTKTNK